MHHESDLRYPLEMPPEQLLEAPIWATRLAHNIQYLLRRVTDLERQLEEVNRRQEAMVVRQETMATGLVPGEG